MTERAVVLCLVALLACGDDDTGGADGGGSDAGEACALTVRSGAVRGDGSAASPFGTLDEALAAASAGDRDGFPRPAWR